ncbi:hypothetical protein NA8A_09199 [Nitratireductor indicus C115]|uniref:Transmembrane protein n=2 Tax=Nitratireductor indicus TaxID=721133 RepID=K2PP31_9HYPH|nr:hypothetical protein NA8A_09199 [Nitratireductor indicus C115]SFQ40958.1 hypothetical protein SAMN05216176_103217 [Nitratireductor indicus]
MGDGVAGMAAMRPSQLDSAYSWFHRLVALACLAMGVFYWIRLIGFYPGLLWRFDLMPIHWKIASVVLSVLYPFAAVGLWLVASWGPVIWFLCAGAELAMYGPLSSYFGTRTPLLVFHLCVAVIYVGLRLALYRRNRLAQK